MDPILRATQLTLTDALREQPNAVLVVGLSGGIDSVVMLHAIAHLVASAELQLAAVRAVHVNHQISPHASDWQSFCQHYCQQLDIPLFCCSVDVKPQPQVSLEATARTLRYAQLTAQARAVNGAIVTAHHQDDQLETVLLQLKRGAGPKGLSGIAKIGQMSGVAVIRPLLQVSRRQIEDYAHKNGLRWVEDESNRDTDYDRNFLRHQVLPQLTARWPAFASSVSRSAQYCAAQQSLLDEVCDERLNALCSQPHQLCLSALESYSSDWRNALLRRWLARNHQPMPSASQLQQIALMSQAQADRQPRVSLANVDIRRFNNTLYCVPRVAEQVDSKHSPVPLESDTPVYFCGLEVGLASEPAAARGAITVPKDAVVRLLRPSLAVAVKPQDQRHSKPIKQWCKLWKIPPWERHSLLLVLADEVPVALICGTKVISLSVKEGTLAYLSVRRLAD